MLNQSRNPRGFGADDKPRCPNCGELTSLTRRAPAAEHALEYERQTFTCFGCERQFERLVDARGLEHASIAAPGELFPACEIRLRAAKYSRPKYNQASRPGAVRTISHECISGQGRLRCIEAP